MGRFHVIGSSGQDAVKRKLLPVEKASVKTFGEMNKNAEHRLVKVASIAFCRSQSQLNILREFQNFQVYQSTKSLSSYYHYASWFYQSLLQWLSHCQMVGKWFCLIVICQMSLKNCSCLCTVSVTVVVWTTDGQFLPAVS